ncbi:hypothetical protein KM043_011528 [Ampulex compressa]|nr:hypothetical protein KM043_011528 [Ampulex compressa]
MTSYGGSLNLYPIVLDAVGFTYVPADPDYYFPALAAGQSFASEDGKKRNAEQWLREAEGGRAGGGKRKNFILGSQKTPLPRCVEILCGGSGEGEGGRVKERNAEQRGEEVGNIVFEGPDFAR